jgi:hypothetical protein
MDQKPQPEIRIKRTITLTTVVRVKDYADEGGQDMDTQQVIDYEKGRSLNEKIQSFMEGLEYSTNEQIELTEEISQV